MAENSWNGFENNCLFANDGNDSFVDMAMPLGIDALGDTRGASVADFNNDGLLDLAMSVNAGKPVIYYNRLKSDKANWLAVKLTGNQSNRDAIGAALELTLEDKTLYRYVAAGAGFAAQSTLTTYFGLGGRTEVKKLVIRWPSGQVDTYEGAALGEQPLINRIHHLSEGQQAIDNIKPLHNPAGP